MKERKNNSSTIIIIILSFLLILTISYIAIEKLDLGNQNNNLNDSQQEQSNTSVDKEDQDINDNNLSAEAKKLKDLLNRVNKISNVQKAILTTFNDVDGVPSSQERETTKKLDVLVGDITNKILDNSGVEVLPEGIGFAYSDSISIYYIDSNSQTRELVILKSSNGVAVFDYRNKYNNEIDNTFYVKVNTSLFDYIQQTYFN